MHDDLPKEFVCTTNLLNPLWGVGGTVSHLTLDANGVLPLHRRGRFDWLCHLPLPVLPNAISFQRKTEAKPVPQASIPLPYFDLSLPPHPLTTRPIPYRLGVGV